MGFFSSKRKAAPSLDRETSLGGIPVLNPGVEIVTRDDGLLSLRVRTRRKPGGWATRFLPSILERKVELDELGSFVVRQLDGCRTTRDLIETFAKQYRVNRREAELSCVSFLRSLAARQAVSIVIK